MNSKTEQDNLYYRELIAEAIPNVNGRDIAIWGTREKGQRAKEALEMLNGTCKFFISSRPKADTCYGVPLLTPDILDVKKHYVLLATQSKEAEQFLRNIGYSLDGTDCIPAFTLWNCA